MRPNPSFAAKYVAPLAAVVAAAVATPGAAQTPPEVTKAVRMCLTPCGRAIRTAPGFTTVTYEITITNTWEDAALTLQVTDDIPVGAVGFRVTNRGYNQPCGAPGNPTCNNIPAPGGANGTGKMVIDNFVVQRAGRLGSSLTVVLEVDFACPPLVTNQIVPNQAVVFSPLNPGLCGPCLSDDPTTPGVFGDPTNFRAVCQPPPPFAVTKTASVTEWRPNDSPVINYRIAIRNDSATDTLFGSSVTVIDNLPTLFNGFAAVNADLTCPVAVTSTPPAALVVDNSNCDWTDPFVRITGLPDLAPGATAFLDFPVTILTDLGDGFDLCNDAFASDSGGGLSNATACTRIVRPFPADFRTSIKTVSPDPASPGAPMTYTLTVVNSGGSPATGVVLSDVFPGCVNDAGFDPARDVTVNPPGPTATYDRPNRTLRVPIGDMPASQGYTVTVRGLVAGPVTAQCCNQAYISADGIPQPGQPTGTSEGLGNPACTAIESSARPSFQQSVKSVTPSPVVEEGTALTYTLQITNSGSVGANDIVVTDILPDCVKDGDFTAGNVVVDPGPSVVDYDAGTRTLTIRIPSMLASGVQTVTMTGLLAGPPDAACCNQAFVSSREIASPGHPTGASPGSGTPSCVSITPIGVGCTLDLDVATARDQIGPLYTLACPVGEPRISGLSGQIPDVLPGQLVDTISASPGLELTLYQFACSCSNDIRLVKDPGPPASVKIDF